MKCEHSWHVMGRSLTNQCLIALPSSLGTLVRAVVWQAVGERQKGRVGSEREAHLWHFGGVSVSVECSSTSWLAQMCSILTVLSKWIIAAHIVAYLRL